MDLEEHLRLVWLIRDWIFTRFPVLLGHEDVQTTQKRYAHHCTESLRIGVDILDADYNLTSVGEKEGFLSASEIVVSRCRIKNWGTRIRTRTN